MEICKDGLNIFSPSLEKCFTKIMSLSGIVAANGGSVPIINFYISSIGSSLVCMCHLKQFFFLAMHERLVCPN